MDGHGEFFTLKGAYPLIARLIRTEHKRTGKYVTRQVLASVLWKDPKGLALFTRAAKTDPEHWSGNMVDWFSKHLTENKRADEWETIVRKRVGTSWAYKSGDGRADEEQMEADAAERHQDPDFDDAEAKDEIKARLARGEYSVDDQWSRQKVRRGQQVWRRRVLDNFEDGAASVA